MFSDSLYNTLYVFENICIYLFIYVFNKIQTTWSFIRVCTEFSTIICSWFTFYSLRSLPCLFLVTVQEYLFVSNEFPVLLIKNHFLITVFQKLLLLLTQRLNVFSLFRGNIENFQWILSRALFICSRKCASFQLNFNQFVCVFELSNVFSLNE